MGGKGEKEGRGEEGRKKEKSVGNRVEKKGGKIWFIFSAL